MKKEIKLNNLIFPIWILWLFPPIVIVAMIGNYIIDSLVILLALVVFKVSSVTGESTKSLYKRSILKVWIFGFLADILGTALLFIIMMILGGTKDLVQGISYNPLSNLGSFLIVFIAILAAAVFIYIFNYNYVFNKLIIERKARLKVALTIAILTMPWTYLIPTEWFFKYY